MTNARLLALGTFALLLPISIENPAAPDSVGVGGETRISVIGAIGHYAIIDRGCEGQVLATHPHPFREAGAEVQHRLPNGLTAGLRGGVLRDRQESQVLFTDYSMYPYRDSLITVVDDRSNTYVNPSLAIERRGFGLGAGWIWSRTAFTAGNAAIQIRWSAHLRAGSRDGPYFKASFMEGVPIYAGGGYVELGLGSRPNRLWDMYAGLGAGGPYDGTGLVIKVDRRVLDHLEVIARARLGGSGGEPQSGVGLGITYVSAPPVEPRHAPRREGSTIESAWGLAPRRPRAEGIRKPPASQRPAEYGTYQHVDSLPVLVQRTPCWQPDISRGAAVTGTVTVAALIGEDGRVREVRVVRSIPALDAAALECVRQWTFRPAMRSGRPVAYWLAVPVTWELD